MPACSAQAFLMASQARVAGGDASPQGILLPVSSRLGTLNPTCVCVRPFPPLRSALLSHTGSRVFPLVTVFGSDPGLPCLPSRPAGSTPAQAQVCSGWRHFSVFSPAPLHLPSSPRWLFISSVIPVSWTPELNASLDAALDGQSLAPRAGHGHCTDQRMRGRGVCCVHVHIPSSSLLLEAPASSDTGALCSDTPALCFRHPCPVLCALCPVVCLVCVLLEPFSLLPVTLSPGLDRATGLLSPPSPVIPTLLQSWGCYPVSPATRPPWFRGGSSRRGDDEVATVPALWDQPAAAGWPQCSVSTCLSACWGRSREHTGQGVEGHPGQNPPASCKSWPLLRVTLAYFHFMVVGQ